MDREGYHETAMSEAILLQNASLQEIQLEILRRTRFNALNGEAVCASLMRHRHLWLAVLLDSAGLPNYKEPGSLHTSGLIKLRDLPENYWNDYTLYILTETIEQARRLGRTIEDEDWGGEVRVYQNQADIDRALGSGRGYGLLSVWWD